MIEPLSDAKIVESWTKNVDPWTEAVRAGQIESRTLVTNKAIVDAVLSRAPHSVLDIGCGEGWLVRALGEHGIRALTGATPDAAGLAVGTASAYISKAPASYTVRFVPAGTAPAARNGAVTITLAATAFAGGTGRSIVAADNTTGGAPLRAFVLIDR